MLACGLWLLLARPPEAVSRKAMLICAAVILLVVLVGGLQADRVARGL